MTARPADNPAALRAFWIAAVAALLLLVVRTLAPRGNDAAGEDGVQGVLGATLVAKMAVLLDDQPGEVANAYGELVLQSFDEIDREGSLPARARALRRKAIWCDFRGLPCARPAIDGLSGIPADARAPAPDDEVELLREVVGGAPISPERAAELEPRLRELRLGWFDLLLRERLFRHAGDAARADAAVAEAEAGAMKAMLAGFAFFGVFAIGSIAWLVALFLPGLRRAFKELGERMEEPDDLRAIDAARLMTVFVTFLAASLLLGPAARRLGLPEPATPLAAAVQNLVAEILLGLVVLVSHRLLTRVRAGASGPSSAGGAVASLGFGGSSPGRALRAGTLTYVLMVPALFVVLVPLSALFNRVRVPSQGHPIMEQLQLSMGSRPALAVWILVAVVGAPLLEEAVFRGALQRSLRARFGPGAAIAISSFAFAIIHPQVGVGLAGILVIGFVLAMLREHQRSLWPSVVLHALNNGVTMAVALGLLA